MSKMPFMQQVTTVFDLILLLNVSHCRLLTTSILLLSHFTHSLYFAVRSVKNQPSYFADRLYKAMKVLKYKYMHV